MNLFNRRRGEIKDDSSGDRDEKMDFLKKLIMTKMGIRLTMPNLCTDDGLGYIYAQRE